MFENQLSEAIPINFAIVVIVILLLIVVFVPRIQIRGAKFETEKDRLEVLNEKRKTVLQALGGAVLIGSVIVALQQVEVTRTSTKENTNVMVKATESSIQIASEDRRQNREQFKARQDMELEKIDKSQYVELKRDRHQRLLELVKLLDSRGNADFVKSSALEGLYFLCEEDASFCSLVSRIINSYVVDVSNEQRIDLTIALHPTNQINIENRIVGLYGEICSYFLVDCEFLKKVNYKSSELRMRLGLFGLRDALREYLDKAGIYIFMNDRFSKGYESYYKATRIYEGYVKQGNTSSGYTPTKASVIHGLEILSKMTSADDKTLVKGAYFIGQDLSDVNFQSLELKNVDLINVTLDGSNLKINDSVRVVDSLIYNCDNRLFLDLLVNSMVKGMSPTLFNSCNRSSNQN